MDPQTGFSLASREDVQRILPRDLVEAVRGALERGETLDIGKLFESRCQRASDNLELCEYRVEWRGGSREIVLRPVASASGRHLLARECPEWARRALIEWYERSNDRPRAVLMKRVASAGWHNFWAVPTGVRDAAAWRAVSEQADGSEH